VGVRCGRRHAEEREGEAGARSRQADGGRRGGGAGGRQGVLSVEAGAGRRRASRGGEGGARGPCVRTWASRGRRELGKARENNANFGLNRIFKLNKI
jgi:hypothetical protein